MGISTWLVAAALLSAPPPPDSSPPAPRRPKAVGLTLSYFGPYFVQPGVKLGVRIPLRAWTSVRTTKRGERHKTRTLFIAPQLGFFGRPNQFFSLLVDPEFGYQALSHKHGLYVAPTIGIAYYAAFQQVTLNVDLATGNQTPTRELRFHVVPTLNYEFGQEFHPRVGWFAKLSYGHDFSPTVPSAIWFSFDVGLSFKLGPVTPRNKGSDDDA